MAKDASFENRAEFGFDEEGHFYGALRMYGEYSRGALNAGEALLVERHLKSCRDCYAAWVEFNEASSGRLPRGNS